MALTPVTITYDISDLVGTDFDARRTKVWVTTNIPGNVVVDTVGNAIRVGDGLGTIAEDGTGSVSVWAPGTGSNPASWQTYVHLDYAQRRPGGVREQLTFGPFTVTTSANLADLIVEQEIPPSYVAEVTAALQEYVDAAEAAADEAESWAETGAPDGALRIYATDDEAVADANPQFAWVILEPPDTTAPTVPTGLTATPGDTQVVLDWTDSTDAVGVTGYRVYRGGVLIGSPAVSTYTDTGRTNGVQYSYTVSAVDAAGNESAQTSPATATPAAAVTVIASDNFNRADMSDGQGDTANGLGTTPVGGKQWTKTGMRAQISGNQVRITSTSGTVWTTATIDAGVANQDVSAKFYPGHTSDKIALVLWYTDASNYLRLFTYGTTGIEVVRVVGGVETGIGNNYGLAHAAGDTWRATVVGTTWTFYQNGVQRLTGSMGSVPSSTKCGIGASSTSFLAFVDDFSVSSA